MSEGARRGLGKVVERRQGVRPVGQVATGDHDHTQLALVRGPLPLWSHWEEKLAMPTVVQQRISVTPQGCRLRFSVTSQPQNALFRHVAAPGRCGATPRQAAGHYGECLNWANALEQPPARLRGGLREGPQISVWSLASRKSALCG